MTVSEALQGSFPPMVRTLSWVPHHLIPETHLKSEPWWDSNPRLDFHTGEGALTAWAIKALGFESLRSNWYSHTRVEDVFHLSVLFLGWTFLLPPSRPEMNNSAHFSVVHSRTILLASAVQPVHTFYDEERCWLQQFRFSKIIETR